MTSTKIVRLLGTALIAGLLSVASGTSARGEATSLPDRADQGSTDRTSTTTASAVPHDASPPCPRCGQACRRQQQKPSAGNEAPHRGRGCCGRGAATGKETSDDSWGDVGCRRTAGVGMGRRHGQTAGPGDPPAGGYGPAGGQRRGMQGRHRAEMTAYRTLLENHESIERSIEQIPGGVRTVTTTSDPELVPTLLLHVTQMKELMEGGGRIRAWDPLFREIFDHAEEIEMTIEPIEGGVAVVETSTDETVAELIRAHAVKVNEFVARGGEAYGEATALPEGYSSAP